MPRRTPALATAALLVLALLVLGLLVRGGPTAIDADVAAWVTGWYPEVLTDVFDTLASLPVVAVFVAIGVVASLLLRRSAAAVAFLVGLASEVPAALVKTLFDRPRPPGGVLVEAFGSIASYPSGHTVRAVVLAGLFGALMWRRASTLVRWAIGIAGMAVVGLVGLARIASGEHWPTDVAGGILLGGAWLILCLSVEAAVMRRAGTSDGP